MGIVSGIFDGRAGRADEGFEALLAPHLDLLWRTAYRFCGNRDDAQDLLQDLLARLLSRQAELAAIEELRPWLMRSLHNLYVDSVRHRARRPLGHAHSDLDSLAPALRDPAPGPAQASQNQSLRKLLQAALAELEPEQRAVVVMHDMEGYSLPELEAQLGVALGTLKSRLFRARRKLRRLLDGNLSMPGDVNLNEENDYGL